MKAQELRIGDLVDLYGAIAYIHQLQNLYFALTGEELEIKKEIETLKHK